MTTKIGNTVQGFYNRTPFPDYELESFNTKEDLEIQAYEFAKILDRSIPEDASIIDVGTGTGQLSAFLSLRRKCVWGIDFSDSSLKKASLLKKKLGLNSWHLKKVDILDNDQIEKIGVRFDYVLCLGVLHHTGDAYKGFQNILKLLKPKGKIAVGLYNTFGRILLKKRILFAKTIYENNQEKKDQYITLQIGEVKDKERARGWWNDQYLHPHETTHMIGEVIDWFKKNNIMFLHTTPSSRFFEKPDWSTAGVWINSNKKPPGLFARVCTQINWIWKTNKEGGYWITFGEKK